MKRIIILIGMLFSINANATMISYAYEGSIESMFYSHCNAYNNNGSCNSWDIDNLTSSSFYQEIGFSVGTSFTGQFTYDTDAALSGMSSDGAQAVYLNAITDYSFSMGAYHAPSTDLPKSTFGSASVVNDRNGKVDSFFTKQTFSSDDWFSSITADFQDHTAQVYDEFSLPENLNLNDFSSPYFHMAFLRKSDGDQLHLKGKISALSPVSLPEPNTLWLLLGAILVLMFKQHQRVFELGCTK